jgi:hypothetical protein
MSSYSYHLLLEILSSSVCWQLPYHLQIVPWHPSSSTTAKLPLCCRGCSVLPPCCTSQSFLPGLFDYRPDQVLLCHATARLTQGSSWQPPLVIIQAMETQDTYCHLLNSVKCFIILFYFQPLFCHVTTQSGCQRYQLMDLLGRKKCYCLFKLLTQPKVALVDVTIRQLLIWPIFWPYWSNIFHLTDLTQPLAVLTGPQFSAIELAISAVDSAFTGYWFNSPFSIVTLLNQPHFHMLQLLNQPQFISYMISVLCWFYTNLFVCRLLIEHNFLVTLFMKPT